MELYSFNNLILSNNLFVVNGRAKFSVLLQRRFRRVFPIPFNLDICTINYATETEGVQSPCV